ncbi:MAG: ATP-grasp domain-containing protein [Spirochaetes bacterium]|nr:ATP-grasp domain-containing protein [Spirochaetota bacterium]
MSTDKRPRLLILGGGSSQLQAIRRARAGGFYVCVADINEAAPGRALADDFMPVSTFDTAGLTAAARQKNIESVLAVGSDQPVYSTAVIAAELGLPHALSPEQAASVTNKAVMKPKLAANAIPTLPFVVLSEYRADWDERTLQKLPLPWVIKPADSQGQRGIRIIYKQSELLEQLPVSMSFSRCRKVLVEEYYPSFEVTMSGWADRRGHTQIWTISDRVTFDPASNPGLGICLGHRYPAQFTAACQGQVETLSAEIVKAFGLRNTPLYFQFLAGARGLVVNEIACRLGGAYEDEWIPLAAGVDSLGRQLQALAALLDLPFSANEAATHTPDEAGRAASAQASYSVAAARQAVLVPLLFARPGVLHRLTGEEKVRRLPGVAACNWLQKPGTRISELHNSTQRLAYAILHSDSREQTNKLLYASLDQLQALDSQGSQLLRDVRKELAFSEDI